MIVSFISKTKFIFLSTFLSQVNVDLLERPSHHYYHPQTWSCLSERSTLAKSIRSSSEMPSSGLDDSRSPPLHCPRTLTQLIERSTPTTTLFEAVQWHYLQDSVFLSTHHLFVRKLRPRCQNVLLRQSLFNAVQWCQQWFHLYQVCAIYEAVISDAFLEAMTKAGILGVSGHNIQGLGHSFLALTTLILFCESYTFTRQHELNAFNYYVF